MKGYTTNWNRELFEIHEIKKTSGVPYNLEDKNTERIEEKFSFEKLLKRVFKFESNKKTKKHESF